MTHCDTKKFTQSIPYNMVSYKNILAANALITPGGAMKVAVFMGGTSGIGKATIRSLVATGAPWRIYLVGRQSAKASTDAFIQEQRTINSKASIVWKDGEVSLLADTRRICQEIAESESQVDLLFMTAGYAPFSGRSETSEGFEVTQSLQFYSRMLLTMRLASLLSRADGRVVSVLAGGKEPASIDTADLDLQRNCAGFQAQRHYAAMNTMALEKLAQQHSRVAFIHSFPGWVDTGNNRRGLSPGSLLLPLMYPIVRLLSYSDEESGQRHLFESTSAMFGGRGVEWGGEDGVNSTGVRANGLFLVNEKCDCVENKKALGQLREAQGEIWAHTMDVLGAYLD